MIKQIIKKQALLFIRNPMQIVLLIGLPIILIFILGNALGGTMDGSSSPINAKIAIIEHQSETKQIQQLLDETNGEPINEHTAIGMTPIQAFTSLLQHESLEEIITVEQIPLEQKQNALQDESYTAIIEVPPSFTYDLLSHSLLEKDEAPVLRIYENEQQPIATSIVSDLVDNFQHQLTLQAFLKQQSIDQQALAVESSIFNATKKTINQTNTISASAYYTVGMTVMNVLYIASTIGAVAFMEKRMYVFNRIIIGDISRWVFFTGVLFSGILFSFLQIMIIFTFSWTVLDVSWPNISDMLLVSLAFSVAVGGITVLLTAVSYRLHSETITNVFSNIIVVLMSFVGGSFFPFGNYSSLVHALGTITPNGAGMTAYLSILKGESFMDVSTHIIYLVLFGLTMTVIAATSFPKRGQSI
ncbi:ABC transporter permease [Pontibacillus litoralis]|uniref:ABC-2 type transporter transmembrane domain-containing protein n=1 Tax=Pontibacillus litoralis JSM 072002 TaxID=1385512 RepID=A0A0A5G0K8_9BACI|nr:ABC transporter permease [Pontibacillus litoralis]KGX86641.1 hypothetical protein N784_04325 [Pontibacillus litoralis JSM 072002]